MKQVIYQPRVVRLTSENPTHKLSLDTYDSLIPKNYNITGIQMEFPKELHEIRIWMTGCIVARFDATMKSYLTTFPIYTSLTLKTNVVMELVYDGDDLEITTPNILFNLKPHDIQMTFIDVPIREKIAISTINKFYKEQLVNNHNLTIIDDNYGIVDNVIWYRYGLGCLNYRY